MKSILTRVAMAAVLGAALVAFTGEAQSQQPKKGGGLKGGYTIVSGEESGKAIPAEKIEGTKVRITEDEFITVDNKDMKIYVAKYKLDTTKTPWAIELTAIAPKPAEGVKASGLVERKGDTVKIIYNLPGGKAPESFKTEEKQNLFVLKNERKMDKK